MTIYYSVWTRTLFLAILCFGLPLHAQNINGIATLNQLGVDVYQGALRTEITSNDPVQLLALTQPMTMEIKILSSITKRRWSSLWSQSVAINSSSEEFMANAAGFAEFLRAVQGNLENGDVVKISFVPGKGAALSINDIALAQGLPPGVFALCLKTWIGSVPFSSEFKAQILGQQGSAEIAQAYASLQPLATRQAIIASWAVPEEDADTTEEIPENQGETEDAQTVAVEEAVAENATTTAVDTPAIDTEPGTAAAGDVSPEPLAQTTPAAVDSAESAPEQVETTVATETTPQPQPQPEPDTSSTPATPAEDNPAADSGNTDAEEDNFSAETLIAQQRYIQQVRSEIYGAVEYPISALRRKLEGSLWLTLTVKSTGELVSMELTQKAEFDGFNKALMRAVQSAAPFPAFPAEMKSDTFTLQTPFAFRLGQ